MHFSRPPVPHSVIRLLAVLTLSAAACGGAAPAPPGAPPPMPVQFQILEEAPIERIGEFVGTIRSRRSTTIQPQAEGFLTRILVTAGTRVTPGRPLFEIDASAQQAVVLSLEAQRASREADAAYARQQTERARALVDAGAISQQELDQAAASLKAAEAQLQAVDQQIRQQQVELGYHRVVAQTSGIVGDIRVRVGDRVTQSTELTTIEDNAGLEVYVSVPVHQAPQVRQGLPVRIVDRDGERLVETSVSFISPAVDDTTQTLLVKAPVDASGVNLRPDQYVQVHLVWSVEPGLRVPVIATQRINSRHFVFVAEDEENGLVARQRPVTLGAVVGEDYIVVDGLRAGDRVIHAGTQKIADGAPVQILPPAPPTPPAAGGR